MKLLFKLVVLIAISPALAQDNEGKMTFDYRDKELSTSALVEDHLLGEDVGEKLALLKQEYVWVEPASPAVPAPVSHVEKASIYSSVKKLERFYKKGVKKNRIAMDQALQELNQVLDVAISVRYQDTSVLEDVLRSTKEPEDLIAVFTERVALR